MHLSQQSVTIIDTKKEMDILRIFSRKAVIQRSYNLNQFDVAKLWKDFPKLKELVFQGTPHQEGSALYIWQQART